MKDVVLISAGKTADGKPLFRVEIIADVPPVVEGKPKVRPGGQHLTERDAYYILRPKRSWVLELYNSVTERLRF